MMAIDLSVNDPAAVRHCLFRFTDDGLPFAYVRRDELIRCRDGVVWAYRSGDRLISARSGACLAVRVGNVYYDPESHEPLYHEQVDAVVAQGRA